MNTIRVNHKSLAEVLACYGLIVLAECLDSPIPRCRFAEIKTVVGDDGQFRSMQFEFEHDDFSGLMNRITGLEVSKQNGKVVLLDHDEVVMVIDWTEMGGFIGDSGNFKRLDKAAFVRAHHELFKNARYDATLFSQWREADTNFLANWSGDKKNYIDAGGVYDSADSRFFARDFLLIVALQNLRHVVTTLNADEVLTYNIIMQWVNPSQMLTGLTYDLPIAMKKMEVRLGQFGSYGKVVKAAKEVEQTLAAVVV